MIQNNSYDADTLHEECGVFGMYDFDGADVASTIYYGLFALQHRGQESCGIAVSDTSGPKGKVLSYKGMGLVNEVFAPENLEQMKGDIGVGHVRYSTAGSSTRENAQPLVLNYVKGTLALAHNGNLINAPQLRRELEYSGAIFQTTIDSEVIAYHIARERVNSASVEEAVSHAMNKIQGAYSLVVMSPRKLVGARDPYGFRPLCIGKRDNTYILASESCALQTIGAEFIRDVEPGEIVSISPKYGIVSDKSHCLPKEKAARCIFEYIYFARPDSHIDGVSVYGSRIEAGKYLAMDSPVDADLVVGVPESGNAAAYTRYQECLLRMSLGVFDELVDIGGNFVHTAVHGGYGIALALHSDALSHDGAEMTYCRIGGTAAGAERGHELQVVRRGDP